MLQLWPRRVQLRHRCLHELRRRMVRTTVRQPVQLLGRLHVQLGPHWCVLMHRTVIHLATLICSTTQLLQEAACAR